jgi:hypothetical protein
MLTTVQSQKPEMTPDKDPATIVPLFNNHQRDSSDYRTEIMFRTIAVLLHDGMMLFNYETTGRGAALCRQGFGHDPQYYDISNPSDLKMCLDDCIQFVDVDDDHNGPSLKPVGYPSLATGTDDGGYRHQGPAWRMARL